MFSRLCFVLLSMQTSFLRNLSFYMFQNRYMSSEVQSCPQNKTQKRNSCARCLLPHILSHLKPNRVGPAPPFFELSFRRFPFKNVCQGPKGRREQERRVLGKATLNFTTASRSPAQLVPRPEQRESLASQHHQYRVE